MVSIDDIRTEMKKRFAIDSALHSVEVNASTIDEALADAAVQLDTKASNLEFEVVEKGGEGFLGIGKKPWKLKIYQNADTIERKAGFAGAGFFSEDGAGAAEMPVPKDGLYYVHRFGSSIKLKVVLPENGGRPVDAKEILDFVRRPDTEQFDQNLIERLAKEGTGGNYETVGSFNHIASDDAVISIDVTKDEMHGYIIVDPPRAGGSELTAEQIERSVLAQRVTAGIDLEKIAAFVDTPVYSTPYEVASAVLPEDGHDSYLTYNFEVDSSKLKAKESDAGNINFKELNKIQNVVAGQVLATKVAATRGKGGKTLFGHYLEAKNGKEIPVQLGQNVEFAQDGVTIVATVAGQVVLANGKITVEPVLSLDAVNIKSGNINFLGSVIIKGNVEDGFDVKASGTIDVGGSVGNCHLESDGNIIIHQGVFGKGGGSIKAGKSLWVKFVQEAKLEVEENLIASDSLMNCEVTAMKSIVLHGKKAQITGGTLFATEEICAKTVGSPGGATTVLSVGVDPRAKKKLDELNESQSALIKELESVNMDISTLENLKNVRRSLPADKEETFQKLVERKGEVDDELKKMNDEILSIQSYLQELKSNGKVKVEGFVYAGTKVYVRDVVDEVHTEISGVTFYYENSFAKRGKYEPPSVNVTKGPDGYLSN